MKSLCLLALLLTAFTGDRAAAQSAATIFQFSPDFPKYVTCDLEFRDPTDQRWPNFLYGKPLGGQFKFDPARPEAAFSFRCDHLAQKHGDQSRRILGDLLRTGEDVVVTVIVTGVSPLQPAAKSKDKFAYSTRLTGTLELAGKKLPFAAETTLRIHDGKKGDEKNAGLMGDAGFELPAGALGLKSLAADAPVRVRFGFSAYPQSAAAASPDKAKKKK